MDTTTLLIIIIVILLVGGGGWYGQDAGSKTKTVTGQSYKVARLDG